MCSLDLIISVCLLSVCGCLGNNNVARVNNETKTIAQEILTLGKVIAIGFENITENFTNHLNDNLQKYSEKCKVFIDLITDWNNPPDCVTELCEQLLSKYPVITEIKFNLNDLKKNYSVKEYRKYKKLYAKTSKLISQILAIKQRLTVM